MAAQRKEIKLNMSSAVQAIFHFFLLYFKSSFLSVSFFFEGPPGKPVEASYKL